MTGMNAANVGPHPSGFESWLSSVRDDAIRGGDSELIESPSSWIVLTRQHAYKIKKAVERGGVCLHALARRLQSCIDEVRLNSRMAPGVYVGVVPMTRGSGGELRLGGKGVPVEWAVKMRRLPGERNLSKLIVHNRLKERDVTILGRSLAAFYFAAPPETERVDALCTRLRSRIEDVHGPHWQTTPITLRRTLDAISAQQFDYLDGARSMLSIRVCDGRIVDGHGDLRPEHIFLERQPAIIDCAEYDAARRRRDALDDLSALTTECRVLRRDDLADQLIGAYRLRTGDEPCSHLEAFYRSLHACDRAAEALKSSITRPAASSPELAVAAAYLSHAKREVDQIL